MRTNVDLNNMSQAHSPAEAWLNLESWHYQNIASAQSLFIRFQTYTMKTGQNPLLVLTTLEEMDAQPMQQNFL